MLKVKLAAPRTGPEGAQDKGATIEVDDAEAARMFHAGQIEPLKPAELRKAEAAEAKRISRLKAAAQKAAAPETATAQPGAETAEG